MTELSDRAAAQHRLITQLTIGDRIITDREIRPELLAEPVGRAGMVRAISQPIEDLVRRSVAAATQYAAWLAEEGARISHQLRVGATALQPLDRWLGCLADYVEWTLTVHPYGLVPAQEIAHWTTWMTAVLEARTAGDLVRIADQLDYEILPQLTRAGGAARVASAWPEAPAAEDRPLGQGAQELPQPADKEAQGIPRQSPTASTLNRE